MTDDDAFIYAKVNKLLRDIQRNNDTSLYDDKSCNDKLTCIICGGFYRRDKRSSHNKTKKHQRKIGEIYLNISNLLCL
jgi:hypothetical protein